MSPGCATATAASTVKNGFPKSCLAPSESFPFLET